MRLKTKWADKTRERTIEETASALAFTLWRIAMDGVLQLENENFQTDTQAQRVDLAEEYSIFLIHLTDRIAYEELDDEQRYEFIKALSLKITDFVDENRQDTNGSGDMYRKQFIGLLNDRMNDYSDCSWTKSEGPGFSMKRTLGDHLATKVGDRDRKWVSTYIIDIAIPDIEATLKRGIRSLLNWDV